MRYLIVISLILTVSCYNVEEEWRNFKEKYGKVYTNAEEELRRFQIFQNHLRDFEEHNELFHRGEVTYSKGINQFTDISQEEIIRSKPREPLRSVKKLPKLKKEILRDVPDTIDWRKKGAVTEVRNKGNCTNGEWAFAAAGAVEGRLFILNGSLTPMSAQSLIDCDEYDGGCRYGLIDTAFFHIMRNGIATEESYAFTGEDGQCLTSGNFVKAVSLERGGNQGEEDDEQVLWTTTGTFGPVAVELDGFCLFTYQSGILDSSCGCTTQMRYEFQSLVVGYDRENGTDYWILKNSWGTDWGEDGYFRLKRDGTNNCGIISMPFYVVLSVT